MSLHEHPAKRRRLDDALSKPFKSPLKVALQPKTGNAYAMTPPSTTQPPNAPGIKSKAPQPSTASTPPPPPRPAPTSSPPPPISLPPDTTPKSHLATLQTHHTTLLTRLSTARQTLEISTQALKIQSHPSRDADLARLIQKWKVASRDAAEEIFGGAREKVNRMGGVRGLRDRERAGREREREGGGVWGWDEGGGGGKGDGEGGGEDVEDGGGEGKEEGLGDREERLEREGRRGGGESEYDRNASREMEQEEEEKEEEVDEEGGYTMDMMLKTMNIDLASIGYDKDLQKWVD